MRRDKTRKGFGDFWKVKRGLTRCARAGCVVPHPSPATTHGKQNEMEPQGAYSLESQVSNAKRGAPGRAGRRECLAGTEDEDSDASRPGQKPPLLTVWAGHFSKSVRSGAPPFMMSRGSEKWASRPGRLFSG